MAKRKNQDPVREASLSLEKFENSLNSEEEKSKKDGFKTPEEEILAQQEPFLH